MFKHKQSCENQLGIILICYLRNKILVIKYKMSCISRVRAELSRTKYLKYIFYTGKWVEK